MSQQKSATGILLNSYKRVRFIQEAPIILPGILEGHKWEELQNFIENWKKSESPSNELIFSLNTLSAIERDKFTIDLIPCDFIYFLDDYARELKNVEEASTKFKYYIRLNKGYTYDATVNCHEFLLFTRSWSRQILATKHLNNSEKFLCQVFAGDIQDPRSVYKLNKKDYQELYSFQLSMDNYNKMSFISKRNKKTGTASLMAGIWLPTSNLKVLGVHPSVGVSLGLRNKKNEYDLVWSFRFISPTPKSYTVIRNDSLFTSNYYDGGYIGFDYTRFFLHKMRFEMGFISAVGYDYFSIANGFGGGNQISSLIPINIGSFDFNNGLRIKYFFHPGSFIGFAVKYHFINYYNKGGTNLSGNAYSMDLTYGSY